MSVYPSFCDGIAHKDHSLFVFVRFRKFGRGIGGQTSYQFLVRFREDVINLSPALVVINAATNDIAENTGAYHEDRTFGNIVSMVELAKANHIKVILTTTLPAAAFDWNPAIKDAPQKIASLNARLKAYAPADVTVGFKEIRMSVYPSFCDGIAHKDHSLFVFVRFRKFGVLLCITLQVSPVFFLGIYSYQ